ncbi:MAG TPA: hypothetical protein VGD67_13050 [Pseudonocardiaceae bacterium]
MYDRLRLGRAGDGYRVRLRPDHRDVIRSAVMRLSGERLSSEVLAVVADETALEALVVRLWELPVDTSVTVEMVLSRAELRAMYGAVVFAYLNGSSEEEFHSEYGFFLEHMRIVGRALWQGVSHLGDAEAPVHADFP